MINVKNKALQKFKFIDLFAGIGGFRLALESLGATCVYSSEWDSFAQRVYEDNFGDRPDGDITLVDERKVPTHDILCAGFPCQSFSISGKQRGFEDSRGTLFFDVARIVKEKRPLVVFMENVKNFASHDNGKTLEVVKATMEEFGYSFYYKVLNSANYGVPQKRERIYMVCFRKDAINVKFDFPANVKLETHLVDILLSKEQICESLYVNRSDTLINEMVDDVFDSKPIRLGRVNKGGQGERIYSIKGTAITLSAYGGGVFAKTGGYLVDGLIRRLHPRECARVMGYPDSFIMAKNRNQAYKQFGNSVVVDVIQYIAIEISKVLSIANITAESNHLTEKSMY